MSVRIIAGSAKGRRIAVPEVAGLRPTSDRARETLFNILAPEIAGARVLDAFAGSGAVGIEALSRGAAEAVFIERDRHAAGVIEANLELCGLADAATVLAGDWRPVVAGMAGDGQDAVDGDSGADVDGRPEAGSGRRFDIVFLDPPYDTDEGAAFLEQLVEHGVAASSCLAIVEHRGKSPPGEAPCWRIARTVDVGDTTFTFYRLEGAAGPDSGAGVGGG